ncbi:MAG TPA: hypothetical protein PKY59_19085 [Pyrinomonadaceae bacterium]|nr:hypothetical protein [Pyrinomonadaceae bacterium]
MKNTLKFALIIALFCTSVFADGNMGGGGFTDGNMGGGGKTCTNNCLAENQTKNEASDSKGSILEIIENYLISIFE